LLNCRIIRDQIENAARTTVGTFKVNNQHVRQLWLSLPPYDEQLAIIKDIEQKISGPSACVRQAERDIFLLHEYRTRLIADIVTGKLDVREAAATLPDEANGREEFDGAEVVVDGNEAAEDADLDTTVEEVSDVGA
jgi:type I restriction enzyme S subunit